MGKKQKYNGKPIQQPGSPEGGGCWVGQLWKEFYSQADASHRGWPDHRSYTDRGIHFRRVRARRLHIQSVGYVRAEPIPQFVAILLSGIARNYLCGGLDRPVPDEGGSRRTKDPSER